MSNTLTQKIVNIGTNLILSKNLNHLMWVVGTKHRHWDYF